MISWICSKYYFIGSSLDFFPAIFPSNMLVIKSLCRTLCPINFYFHDLIIFISCLFFVLLLSLAHFFSCPPILFLLYSSTYKFKCFQYFLYFLSIVHVSLPYYVSTPQTNVLTNLLKMSILRCLFVRSWFLIWNDFFANVILLMLFGFDLFTFVTKK